MTVEINPVSGADLDAILELGERTNEAQVIPHLNAEGQDTMRAARRSDITSIADTQTYRALKATLGSKLVGYIAWREGNYVAQLYVCPQHQRLGIGRRLIEAVKAQTSSQSLELKASVNAIGFYRRCGFIKTDGEQVVKGIRYVPMVLKLEP
ncbi:GNAT family N-acetyltransferase [Ferrimonas marina]|uniref:Acetyltransferase (GNAT) domain-containing protein n=1 Tax=Ferrimonas marina TaxID=299255 RepID=A0A1M5RCF4_9GAMM|nr:GNAT family N-acetyltransferase [Ferrimonas marina]SHH23858.1 Acetyltransferase (GNAT) domain-containing protein [Ferrimonas marina]